jgi:uroporphyrin-III C-methyltransferase/precorrin-2 dehydrogenase/sirohydrochlorin ferrochelatase
VRLKGGDPFLFGRGGEEALALREAGIAFDVVPGVTSAVAAPALAGIPVTHRGVSHALVVVGGYEAQAFEASVGALQPNGVTLVVLMGMGRRGEIAEALVRRGWRVDTPAAIVMDASRRSQQVWRGSLADLGAACLAGDGAATIVVGKVAALDLAPSAVVRTFRSAPDVGRTFRSAAPRKSRKRA